MKTYFAAIIKPFNRAIVWGIGKTESGARKDAVHWINDYCLFSFSYKKEQKEAEKKKLKIVRITERVRKFVDDAGGYEVKLCRLKDGVYDLR